MEKINELKQRHDELHKKGCDMLDELEAMAKEVVALRQTIEQMDPDEYDPIRMIFGGRFNEDDE